MHAGDERPRCRGCRSGRAAASAPARCRRCRWRPSRGRSRRGPGGAARSRSCPGRSWSRSWARWHSRRGGIRWRRWEHHAPWNETVSTVRASAGGSSSSAASAAQDPVRSVCRGLGCAATRPRSAGPARACPAGSGCSAAPWRRCRAGPGPTGAASRCRGRWRRGRSRRTPRRPPRRPPRICLAQPQVDVAEGGPVLRAHPRQAVAVAALRAAAWGSRPAAPGRSGRAPGPARASRPASGRPGRRSGARRVALVVQRADLLRTPAHGRQPRVEAVVVRADARR